MKKILIVATFSLIALAIKAQDSTHSRIPRQDRKSEKRQRINALLKLEEEGDPAFRKQNIFGIKLATDGYGISFEKGRYKTPRRTLLYQFELNEKKNPKEEKTASSQNIFTGQVNSVIWGKANNFYQFKLGLGQQYLIGGKANKSGVAVSAIYAGGISIGLAKPYEVDVINEATQEQSRKKFTDSADGNTYQLIGASGFTHGWNEVKVKPGLHAKVAMRFDYGRFNETVSAIEAGLNAEYYFSKVEQLIYVKPKPFFFNAYITILFGRRK
ncbi:MAG TPA: hypothetical protein VKI61_12240 [Chitinophagaceae bacterium]|nr:hypothetical protein [Chitinophagaceae bacterium]